ncbi:hypothetical protein IKC_06155 [Bacillus cereus VD184]|uniref:Uncharacterized protein n=1 Tax=Bacillus cereus VD184 TaxID=1053242 RepID=A0A9W5R059_BACCE|nr:hypothetical protein IKC_06155 [Bacillus cereus VD184]
MKVKAKVECIDSLFNRVGDILEVSDEYGKHLIGIDWAESAEEKKAPAKKPAPKSKAKE